MSADTDAARRRRRLERRARAVRVRRRRALLGVAAVALVCGAIVGAGAGDGQSGEAPGPTASAQVCPSALAADPRRLIGQMLIVRMEDRATEKLRRRVRDGEIGGVVLFPSPGVEPAKLARQVTALRAAAERGGSPAPLVAIDQEGGEVRRLPTLPPRRSPAEIAAAGEPVARAEGAATGRALARLGIDVDLAPVLDLAAGRGAFIASRSLGQDPRRVAALGAAFAAGLGEAGVAATAKHFPGLGPATTNTDLAPSVIETTDRQLERGLIPFRALADADVELIMVSNATYPAIDPARPGSQSRRVVGDLLRDELGFDGVVITDDLGAGALAGAGLEEGEAAVGAARAGADLLLVALSDGGPAADGLRSALRRGELDRRDLLASCARVSALRSALGQRGQR